MSIFINIDPKLKIIANRLQATLKINRDWDPEAGFEERRIDWVQDEINKAIIIQPTFESTGVNSTLWVLYVFAWLKINGVAQKPGWKKIVVKEDFRMIETEIDRLLEEAIKHLLNVKIEDVIKRLNT